MTKLQNVDVMLDELSKNPEFVKEFEALKDEDCKQETYAAFSAFGHTIEVPDNRWYSGIVINVLAFLFP